MAAEQTAVSTAERTSALEGYIFHHIANSEYWTITPSIKIPLPSFMGMHGLMLLICAGLLLFLFGVCYRRNDKVPRGISNLLEVFVLFIRDGIARPNLGEADGNKMTPILCTFFFFILGLNLLGLIPLFATATSNVSVTASLALVTLAFMVFGSIYKNGIKGFISCFVPHGVPWPVLILLVPIEFAGMFIRAFALTIRLFANMLAGHIVIYSLLGLVFIFGYAAFPAIALALGIYFLELFVAFLQAYIFTLLSAMFIGQMYHPAH
jgi:F-type H+-transporting ATPase subunit a